MITGPTQWVKSGYSSPEGGNCLEWCPASASTTGVVPVRDSKAPDGPVLTFPTDGWMAFVGAVRSNESFSGM
ncbi:DUF397 domain-containing protein [Streptomyces sp. VTCC 41912]|uniref:DUF397 domain-containing protein n=1 Tax=Streptomyces sp. VTCC 41912 TaxID=3383243 RepID=UPI003896E097